MIDSYSEIGNSHLVCQDYVLHGTVDKMTYGIISDGCSSAEYSEIGAQILCHAAKCCLILYYKAGLFKECSEQTLSRLLGNSILKRADVLHKLYSVSSLSLQATLLISLQIENDIYVFAWGDGLVILKDKNNNIKITKIDYPNNMPFYLSTNKDDYSDALINRSIVPKVNYEITHISGFDSKIEKEYEEFEFFTPYIFHSKYAEDFVSLTICSDGVCSYRDLNKNSIEISKIVPQIINFKSTTGEFIKKRMSFFKKSIENLWTHYDDVSISTIFNKQVFTKS